MNTERAYRDSRDPRYRQHMARLDREGWEDFHAGSLRERLMASLDWQALLAEGVAEPPPVEEWRFS